MQRSLYNSLINWKNKSNRKPLVLEGARQVGKTWLLKEFGKNEYENLVYLDCSKMSFIKELFTHDLEPRRIIRDVVANTGQQINHEKTLIFFDEIQEVPRGITALKYFCEDTPQLHVVAAGSLLGIVNHPGESYPVGKVNRLRLYPLTFEEFLMARGYTALARSLSECDWGMIDRAGTKLKDLLRQYYYVGGMPEVVTQWIENEDVLDVREIQNRILGSYVNDISKHAGRDTTRVTMVWNSIPAQLARENKKFFYSAVKKGARAKDFETAIQWLVNAGLVYRVQRCTRPESPLKFYEDFDAFKLFLLDVGLLGALSEAEPGSLLTGERPFKEFKGAFTENYVLEQLKPIDNLGIYYFSKENSQVEVDFLLQTWQRIIPLEVKAEVSVKSKSLSQFINVDHAALGLKGVRSSMQSYIDQGWMENVPLCAVKAFVERENRFTR